MTSQPAPRGTVFQRQRDQRWVARITQNGKRVERIARTAGEAVLLLENLRSQAAQEEVTAQSTAAPASTKSEAAESNTLYLDAWVSRWLERVAQDHRPTTLDIYRRSLRVIMDQLGRVELARLTPLLLDDAFNQLAQDGVGSRVQGIAYSTLRTCLNRAVDLELIPRNPLLKVAKPRASERQRRYWSPEEVQRVLVTAEQSSRSWDDLFVLLLLTGMRVSEALGLTWEDIDLEARSLAVNRAYVWAGNAGSIQPPKTKAGIRSISLPKLAVLVLSRLPRRGEYVFRTSTGSVPSHTNLRRSLHRLCEAAVVPEINPHGLRHVHAMLTLRSGIDHYALQRRLGHSHVNVTLGIYGYSLTDDAEISRSFDDFIGSEHRE